ncbi:MAG TPA: FecR family protein [Niabella sp.]|nr:FecR family protein [Niabella sp.]
MNMDQQRLITLLIKKETGAISLSEQTELMALMKEVPDADIAAVVSEIFKSAISFEKDIPDDFVQQSVVSLQQRITPLSVSRKEPKQPRSLVKVMAIAASLLALIGLGSVLLLNNNGPAPALKQNIVATQKGSKSNIILPDGTTVWINSDTRLTYEKSFGERKREVALEGEAFFEVVHDKNRPFIVHTKNMDVRVLGTVFNVRAYNNEAEAQATLVSGSVEVLLKAKNNKKVILKPSEKLIVQNDYQLGNGRNIHINNDSAEVVLRQATISPIDSAILETQWLKSSISFDQQKLQDIIPMLENWYDVKITVNNRSLLQKRFNGKIEKESLKEVLHLFSLVSELRYKIEEDNVTIYK